MKSLSSVFGGIGLALITTALALGGCGGDNSVVAGTGGGSAVNTGGTSNVGGGGATGGASNGGATGCAPVTVPENALMTDFSTQTEGQQATIDTPSISWGTSTTLTGGTFLYHQEASDAPTGTITSGTLHLTATIAATHYNGFGFYFGPKCGSDASAYSGFQFEISGAITGAAMDIQVQMTPNYPLNDNDKGTCDYEAAGAEKWDYCTNPHVTLSAILGEDVPFPETPTTIQVPWSTLVGGNPVDAIDPTQLLGIQFQFNCGDVDCPIDVTLDNLSFY